jgi:signal transduction histidine kinase
MDKFILSENQSRVLYVGIFILALLVASWYNYLLFHTIAELWSIVIAVLVSVIVWNSKGRLDNSYLIIVGVAYAYVAVFDVLHTLTYSGINIISGYGTDLPTQLWLVARFIEAGSLFFALFFLRRKLVFWQVNLVYSIIAIAAFLLIFVFTAFPAAHIETHGLTSFKIISEYCISGLLFLALLVMYRKRKSFDYDILRLLNYSIAFTLVSELIFTLYIDVYGVFNLAGHITKILSFYFIYLAIAKAGIVDPQKNIFKQLADKESKLARANRAKSEFVYFVSHQFKNPLTSIQLTVDLLKKGLPGSLTNEQRRYLGDIEGSADKMKELMDTYLNVSKMEMGILPNEPEPLDVGIQLQGVIDNHQRSLEQKSIELEFSISKKRPVILMDPNLFDLVFDNLLSNAVNYSQIGGSVKIAAGKKGDDMVISVRDNGCGIPKEARNKVFSKLYRAANVKNAGASGTGLGLYMVKLVLDTLGAHISFRSVEGEGTIFEVVLPLDKFKA